MEKHEISQCNMFHGAMELIGKRWTGLIIYNLCAGPKRFSELSELIPDISSRLLTERLKELENNFVVIREVITDRPIQVSYSLTEKGKLLQPIFDSISSWAKLKP